MGVKEVYQKKLEAQLQEWAGRIKDLKGKVDKVSTETSAKYQEEIEGLWAKYEAAQKKLKEVRGAGEEMWEAVRAGMEKAWDELAEGMKRAAARVTTVEEPKDSGRDEEIRAIAYRIWEEEGRPEGRASEHWLKAEAIWEKQHGREAAVKQNERPAQSATRRKRAIGPKHTTEKSKAR